MSEATHTSADLEEVEIIKAWKEIQATTERRGTKGRMKVSRLQMWVDLIKAGVVKEKLDGQPYRILLELWHQLEPEQQFQPLRSRAQKPEAKPHVQPVSLQDFLGNNTQGLPGPSP